ncbi:MAG: adenylate/guanylate cyclase domain-containing protein [Pseudomonadota bacterium]
MADITISQPPARKRRFGRPMSDVPLSRLLAITFGLLTAIGIGLVLTLMFTANVRNTYSLLNARAVETIDSLDRVIAAYMEPPQITVASIAGQISKGEVDFYDDDQVLQVLRGAITANRMVVVLFVVDENFEGRGAFRQGDQFRFVRKDVLENPAAKQAFSRVNPRGSGVWGPLVYEQGSLHANVGHPIIIDGEFKGHVVAAVPLPRLSVLTKEIGNSITGTPFILGGQQDVLAHPSLAVPELAPSPNDFPDDVSIATDATGRAPPDEIFKVKTFSDPVLRGFSARDPKEDDAAFGPGDKVWYSDVSLDTEDHFVLWKSINKYADRPWVIGVHYPRDTIDGEIERLYGSAFVGFMLLLFATALAAVVGRRMGKPFAQLNTMAGRVTSLDFDHVKPMEPSRVREFNEASQTLNRMVDALRAFAAYVPRTLVQRLVESGVDAARSEERQVTVMFTDVVGFTHLSEHMTAAETAHFLNEHFAIMCAAVEETGGTVDKFMGDGMMAFWGAPDATEDHAVRACRSALAMRKALEADNRKREERGEPPVHVRVGIHTGPAIVGNIGTRERINYTIVGDTVNVTQRLEALGKVVGPNDAFVALLSAENVAVLPDDVGRTPLSAFQVPGRDAPIQVYQLDA